MVEPAKTKSVALPARFRSKERQIRFLALPLLLEEAGPPRLLSQLLIVLTILLGGLIGFASMAQITESSNAQGQIVPSRSVNLVQHLEGGIVADILVQEGDIVEQGQSLIRLEAAASLAELDQMRAREASLALRAERLRSFVLDRNPDFSDGEGYADLVEDQSSILAMQIEARDSQRKVLQTRIEQRRAQLRALAEQKVSIENQVDIIAEQLQMRETLLKKGLASRVIYLETERSLSRTQGELAKIAGQELETRASLAEAESSLLELDATLRNDAVDEMGGVTGELAQVREAIAKLEDRVVRLEITAPTRGVVKGLSVRTIGAVIGPGEQIMELVPLDDELVAEVQVAPRDIGHLELGQLANLTVSTYDVARFGVVEGRLKHLSASTFEDEQGEVFYKGVIALSQSYVGTDPERNPIQPGMVVDVEIVTGSRSLLEYLLRPVYRGLQGSFRER